MYSHYGAAGIAHGTQGSHHLDRSNHLKAIQPVGQPGWCLTPRPSLWGAFASSMAARSCLVLEVPCEFAHWRRLRPMEHRPKSMPYAWLSISLPLATCVYHHDQHCYSIIEGPMDCRHIRISGLVVEYIVAINVTRVRFPADAHGAYA